MEAMDCDSPAHSSVNSAVNSDSEELNKPVKKPRLIVKVKSITLSKEKNTPTKRKKKSEGHSSRFLKEIEDNEIKTAENSAEKKSTEKKKRKFQVSKVQSTESLKMDEESDMVVDDFDIEANKENQEQDLQQAEEAIMSSLMVDQENDISQEDIEAVIVMENSGHVSRQTPDSFNIRREELAKVSEVTSVTDPDDIWNSFEEIMERNRKNATPQKHKQKRLSRSLKKIKSVDSSDESDTKNKDNEKPAAKYKPMKIRKGRPSCSAKISKVRCNVLEEYNDEADDEPEEMEVSQEAVEKARARLERLTNMSTNNNADGVFEGEGQIEETAGTSKAKVSRVMQIGDDVFAHEENFEVELNNDEVEDGFRSNDCNDFSDILRIDNDDDIDIPGCSKPIDKEARPPPVRPLLGCDSDSDSDEPGPPQAAKRPRKTSSSGSPCSESDGEEGSIQAIRKFNKKRMKSIIKQLRDKELEEKFKTSNDKKGKSLKYGSAPRKRKRGPDDSPFKFSGIIPKEKRRSSRLQKSNPEYTYEVLDNVHETMRQTYFKRPNYDFDDYLSEELEDLEKVVHKPKRKSTGKRKVEEHIIIPVEEVTQKMLDNIALRVKGKVYSADGTTCHQCRQKTMDQKTCCRNPECSGMLGMFCGVCIKNRYGEEAADALLNPNWICPVCRGKCNCSICRTKQGKRPTGVLLPLAQRSGYESVDHFLDTLRGEGDRPQDDYKYILKRDPQALLGFSRDGRKAHFQDGSSYFIYCILCVYKDCDDPDNLLGFSKDGNIALMGGRREEPLFKPKTHFFSLLRLRHV